MHNITRTLKAMCLALAPLAWGIAAMPTLAQGPTVQVRDEPLHHLRLETDKFRVYNVVVDQRDAMQFHEHRADNVAVFLSESQITNEFANGQTADFAVKLGLVAFASASSTKPYVHRILFRGGEPFRNITIEFLKPLSSTPPSNSDVPLDSALVFLRESPRGKAYRLALEPEQSVNLPLNASDIFVVCLTEGRVTRMRSSRPNDGVTCVPGTFSLLDRPEAASLKNEGRDRVELTVIAVH